MDYSDLEEVIGKVIADLDKEANILNIQNGPYLARVALTSGWDLIEQKVREQVAREIREHALGLAWGGQAASALLAMANRIEKSSG